MIHNILDSLDSLIAVPMEEINDLAAASPSELVRISEERYREQIRSACRHICADIKTSNIVLLAGPSASGKTTTAHILRAMLKREFRVNSYVISLDDFYIDQAKLPRLADGTLDLETIYATDLDCVHRCFDELSRTSQTYLPTYDFVKAARRKDYTKLKLKKNEILIVEGIHALNPLITEGLNQEIFTKLFISVKGEYRHDGKVVLGREDIRFVRRCVRDINHRGASLERTAEMWNSVRSGEKKYITPFKRYADITIDSLILYEPCIFHHFINPYIETMDKTSPHYPRFEEIHDKLANFSEIDTGLISGDSVLREFIY